MIAIERTNDGLSSDVSRRQFLRTTGLATGMGIGLLSLSGCDWWCKLFGSCPNCDQNNPDPNNPDCKGLIFSFECSSIFDCMKSFAINIGGQVLNQLIGNFTSKLPGALQQKVSSANAFMRSAPGDPFNNLTLANVHKTGDPTKYNSGDMIFYPAVAQSGYNICVPFVTDSEYCNNQDNPNGTPLVEGPSMLALTTVSEALKATSASPDEINDQTVPRCTIQAARGGWGTSYDKEEILTTKAGRVRISYRNTSGNQAQGTGKTHFISEKLINGRFETVLDKWYTVEYP